MSIKPPRAAVVDPRVVEALDALRPSQRATIRSPDDPRVNPPLARGGGELEALRARAAVEAERQRARDVAAARNAPDPGRVLVALPRVDGTELRVSLHTYEGRPFVRVAPWSRGPGGDSWPVRGKGSSLKVRELAAVAAALLDALDVANDESSRAPSHAPSHGQETSRRT